MVYDVLKERSYALREDILRMITTAGSGHPAGSLSVVDSLYVLYKTVLRHNPKKPLWKDRDRVVLSAGHLCPALYAVLCDQGYFPRKELLTLRKLGSRLQGHPEMGRLPGVENTGGPLGQGLSFAVGKALVVDSNVYCFMSEGDHQEGATWEAVQLAAQHELRNLCVVVDRNNIQIDGNVEDEVALRRLRKKYESFGWTVLDVTGHNFDLLHSAFRYFSAHQRKTPFCIVSHSVAGKGVSFLEGDYRWHGRALNGEQLRRALDELERKRKRMKVHHHLKRRGVLR